MEDEEAGRNMLDKDTSEDDNSAISPSILCRVWVLIDDEDKLLDKTMHRLREKRKWGRQKKQKPSTHNQPLEKQSSSMTTMPESEASVSPNRTRMELLVISCGTRS